MQSSKHDVKQVLEAVSGFINAFSSSIEDNELFFLSRGVPAKPDIAKNLLEAQLRTLAGKLYKTSLTYI